MNVVAYHRARLVVGCGLQIAHCLPEMACSMRSTVIFSGYARLFLMKSVVLKGINPLGRSVFSHTYV